MDEQSRKARIAELQARMDKEKALLRKDTRAADNKRKYLLGSLVIAGLEESQQLRKWVLKAIAGNPPRDSANQNAILPLLEEIAKQEGTPVPELPEPPKRKKKNEEVENDSGDDDSSSAVEPATNFEAEKPVHQSIIQQTRNTYSGSTGKANT